MLSEKRRLISRTIGDPRTEGIRRSLKGAREGDYRELSLGLALAALAYLRTTKPRKLFLSRMRVRTGSALVINHKKSGAPTLEIFQPTRR
jgi:hypothetical protein